MGTRGDVTDGNDGVVGTETRSPASSESTDEEI